VDEVSGPAQTGHHEARARTRPVRRVRVPAGPLRHVRAPNRATQRVLWFTALVWALALALGLGHVVRLPALPVPVRLPWWVLAIGFALTERFAAVIRFREDGYWVSFDEVPLVLGLVFASPAALVLAVPLGNALVLALHRRQRPIKLAFNTGQFLLQAGAAVSAYRLVLGHAGPLGPVGWAAAFAGVAAGVAVNHGAITAVMSLSAGRLQRGMLGANLAVTAVMSTVAASLALVAAYVVWQDVAAVWLFGVVGGLAIAGHRVHTTLRQRYANLHALYGFTRATAAALEEGGGVGAMLELVCELMRAGRAELVLLTPGGRAVRTSLRPGAPARSRPSELGEGSLERHVAETGEAVLVARTEADPGLRQVLEELGAEDLLAAPLRGGPELVGALLVADRVGEATTFDREDLRLFEALANHAAMALRNERLVAELRREAAEKEHRALHDALTGLPNRAAFHERVTSLVARPGSEAAVMLIDLDRFKEVNDTLGHHNGDVLLKEAALRLLGVVEGRGYVARLGGDEFAIALGRSSPLQAVLAVAGEARAALETPFALEELGVEIGASVGIALSPEHGSDATTLLQRADVAMYAAKEAHRGVQVYSVDDDHYSPRRLALVAELRRAIGEGALSVHYQPLAHLRTGAVVGVEALVRWPHPRHGFLPPDEFVPIAEHTGLIRPLTRFVLDTALRQCAAWRARGLELSVAVNISVRSLLDAELARSVADALAGSGLPPSALTLEITESTVMADLTSTEGTLGQLSELGVTLAIDDFGTGYSSLSYLQRLPVDAVKIDKSFIIHMRADPNDAAIVRSTIDLARNLGLQVIAEGVEDEETWDRLRALDCDLAQGYLLSKPMPAARLEPWLATYGGGLRPPARPPRAAGAPELRVVPGGQAGPTSA
jgi:diguanylate cyclase (GGDEF)-like protein